MAIFDQKTGEDIKKMLSMMKEKVNIIYFTQSFECITCKDTRQFLNEFKEFSDKINLTVFDFQTDSNKAQYYKIDKIPAILLLDKDDNDTGIRFYGPPAGYEINSFIASILEVSGNKDDLPEDIIKRIKAINKEIHIQVFVTLVCPYCPDVVKACHRLALENPRIKADMVESSTFPQLAVKYNIQGVPKTIINEKNELTGSIPLIDILNEIEKI